MKNLQANNGIKLALALALMLVAQFSRAQQNVGTSAITPQTQPVETGPILDVVPYVLADGYTINMALIPSVTVFNGYDTPPNVPSVTGNLNVVQLPVVLPSFTVRQVVTTVNVWDNQTVVIGDLPMVGNLFQSSSKTTQKKNLMIFVTATIVDPAGNRVHSDDDLPFAQTAVPPQLPGNGQVTESVQKISAPVVNQ